MDLLKYVSLATTPHQAVSAGADYLKERGFEELTLGKAFDCRQHIFHRIRTVGIIDQDGVVLARRGNDFHPSLHRGDLRQNRGASFQRNAQRQRGDQQPGRYPRLPVLDRLHRDW